MTDLTHLKKQIRVWVQYRYDDDQTELSDREKITLAILIGREEKGWDNLDTETRQQLQDAFTAALAEFPDSESAGDCEQCGDDMTDTLLVMPDNDHILCGTCCEAYTNGWYAALAQVRKLFQETGVPLTEEWENSPYWQLESYSLEAWQ